MLPATCSASSRSKFRYVVSLDPGHVNNGFCFFKYDVEKKRADTLIIDKLTPKMLSQRLKQIWMAFVGKEDFDSKAWFFIVENFRVDSHIRGAMFQWNDMSTSRQIGKVEFVAEGMNATCVLQEPAQVLPMARKWASPYFNMKKQHIDDEVSAWCHGVHFMMKRNWIGTPDQVTIKGQQRL